MKKKISPAVKQFASKFSDALLRDSWGDIAPGLFANIAFDTETSWSEDTAALAVALEKALR